MKMTLRQMMDMQTKENEHVVPTILQGLQVCGIKAFKHKERIPRYEGDKNLSEGGISDIIGHISPKTFRRFSDGSRPVPLYAIPLYIECKRPKGAHRDNQDDYINDAREDCCIAFFAERWDDVVREMAKFGMVLPG